MARATNDRQAEILKIVKENAVGNQTELALLLHGRGYDATQSSISRDLAALNIVKAGGVYRVPRICAGESSIVESLDIATCGANLLVLKTGPGSANVVAYTLDTAEIPSVLGTIAGDDTVFVAVDPKLQSRTAEKIVELFTER